MKIDYSQTENLLKVDVKLMKSSHVWDSIVHKSNIIDILNIGDQFKEDLSIFTPLVERFKFKNEQQARGIYSYIKYMGSEFLLMKDDEV